MEENRCMDQEQKEKILVTEDSFFFQMDQEVRTLGIELSEEKKQQFLLYYKLLIDWNSRMNLTAITEQREVVTKHFVDSLSIIKVLPEIKEKSYRLIDVGTGAGFPGIPLKIAFPQLEITLLDSLNKRVGFLKEVSENLQLEKIHAVHSRAEDYGHQNVSRETFDLCVSRAVANLSTLSEYCIPLVKVGGVFVSYKAGNVKEELERAKRAVEKLGGSIENVSCFQLPNADERSLIVIRKKEKTGKRYPRKAGMPGKEPL